MYGVNHFQICDQCNKCDDALCPVICSNSECEIRGHVRRCLHTRFIRVLSSIRWGNENKFFILAMSGSGAKKFAKSGLTQKAVEHHDEVVVTELLATSKGGVNI